MDPVGIGLCAVFGGFMVVLLVEAFHIVCGRSVVGHGSAAKLSELRLWSRRLTHGLHRLPFVQCGGRLRADCSASGNSGLVSLQIDGFVCEPQASPSIHSELLARIFPLQTDFLGSDDALNLQDLLGPPRLLFTIREETREDLESDEGKSKAGRSRGTSRTSSEFLPPLPDSDCDSPSETPFHTPPSSPAPAMQEEEDEMVPEQKEDEIIAKEEDERKAMEVASYSYFSILNSAIDESCPSFSSTSSENVTPPILPSPPKPLGTLMEESSSASSEATPFLLSPSKPASKYSWESMLNGPFQIRVYPMEGENSEIFVGCSKGSKQRAELKQSPALLSTPASPSWPPSPHTWPPSPSTPPLCSALSSPIFTSPVLEAPQQKESCLAEA